MTRISLMFLQKEVGDKTDATVKEELRIQKWT